MAGNPLIDQGVLNRVRGSINWDDHAELNVTAPYLGRDGIRLALDGESTQYFPTMTGAVPSPEPYMMVTFTIHLLKTQALAGSYKSQMEDTARIGNCTIRPDASTLPPYDLINCSIESVGELDFSGQTPDYPVRCRGYYVVNNSIFDT